jgi:ribosomal protein S18 acetylase RimI-like enzyme
MKLRKACEQDAEQIGKILMESYNICSVEEGKHAFLEEIANNTRYIVAEDDGSRVVGLVTWFTHGLPKHGLVELDRIAVLPEYRRNGISRQLFEELIKDANDYLGKNNAALRKLFLMTHADNLKAQSFYQKMGMQHESTIPSHFYNGLDEFVMSMYFK